MATITQVSNTTWQAEFNRRQWRIVKNKEQLDCYRLDGDKAQKADTGSVEVRSLLRFYSWHVQSKRTASELPTLFALVDGRNRDND